jgi:hypothetical protein
MKMAVKGKDAGKKLASNFKRPNFLDAGKTSIITG